MARGDGRKPKAVSVFIASKSDEMLKMIPFNCCNGSALNGTPTHTILVVNGPQPGGACCVYQNTENCCGDRTSRVLH